MGRGKSDKARSIAGTLYGGGSSLSRTSSPKSLQGRRASQGSIRNGSKTPVNKEYVTIQQFYSNHLTHKKLQQIAEQLKEDYDLYTVLVGDDDGIKRIQPLEKLSAGSERSLEKYKAYMVLDPQQLQQYREIVRTITTSPIIEKRNKCIKQYVNTVLLTALLKSDTKARIEYLKTLSNMPLLARIVASDMGEQYSDILWSDILKYLPRGLEKIINSCDELLFHQGEYSTKISLFAAKLDNNGEKLIEDKIELSENYYTAEEAAQFFTEKCSDVFETTGSIDSDSSDKLVFFVASFNRACRQLSTILEQEKSTLEKASHPDMSTQEYEILLKKTKILNQLVGLRPERIDDSFCEKFYFKKDLLGDFVLLITGNGNPAKMPLSDLIVLGLEKMINQVLSSDNGFVHSKAAHTASTAATPPVKRHSLVRTGNGGSSVGSRLQNLSLPTGLGGMAIGGGQVPVSPPPIRRGPTSMSDIMVRGRENTRNQGGSASAKPSEQADTHKEHAYVVVPLYGQ